VFVWDSYLNKNIDLPLSITDIISRTDEVARCTNLLQPSCNGMEDNPFPHFTNHSLEFMGQIGIDIVVSVGVCLIIVSILNNSWGVAIGN